MQIYYNILLCIACKWGRNFEYYISRLDMTMGNVLLRVCAELDCQKNQLREYSTINLTYKWKACWKPEHYWTTNNLSTTGATKCNLRRQLVLPYMNTGKQWCWWGWGCPYKPLLHQTIWGSGSFCSHWRQTQHPELMINDYMLHHYTY